MILENSLKTKQDSYFGFSLPHKVIIHPAGPSEVPAGLLINSREGAKLSRGAYQNRPTAHLRPEADPARRAVFANNKKIILATQSICGICGQPIDKSLKYPDPMSPTVDHIIPCNRGGSDDLDNLQLAHRKCNRLKSDKMPGNDFPKNKNPNNELPQSVNWRTY